MLFRSRLFYTPILKQKIYQFQVFLVFCGLMNERFICVVLPATITRIMNDFSNNLYYIIN